jgi:phage host-nuclease inhibitor protein Gam
MKTKTKSKSAAHLSRAEIENLIADVATAMNDHRRLAAEMDERLNVIREEYSEPLKECQAVINDRVPLIQSWAETHREEFGKRKSLEFGLGTIGWRTGTHKLKTLAKWTWDRVLEKIKSLPAMKDYVRVKEEVNRETIIADREHLGPEMLAAIGVRVVQEESFFVEPKLTEIESQTTTASPAKQAA